MNSLVRDTDFTGVGNIQWTLCLRTTVRNTCEETSDMSLTGNRRCQKRLVMLRGGMHYDSIRSHERSRRADPPRAWSRGLSTGRRARKGSVEFYGYRRSHRRTDTHDCE